MDVLRPADLPEALEMAAARPDARPLAGGTDVMVELNMRGRPPAAMLDLGRVGELARWGRDGDALWLGGGLTHAQAVRDLGALLPALAAAARTVGSPQIRNRGTIGGNAGTASPAGDALPALYAMDALVRVASSAGGERDVPIDDFVKAPRRTDLRPGELITGFLVPAATGPQAFAKVGPRNAMVIAVCSFALALRPGSRRVRGCAGSVAPTPLRVREAERFIEGVLDEHGLWDSRGPIPSAAFAEFGRLVAAATRPIDDVRGTAGYRAHAAGVIARRTLSWTWTEYRASAAQGGTS
ncbi:FAD binding domain-containing protein [Actinomadura sp. 3N508]|uniref:FAD binding domain-containing protein n=1 Tax=Actinomadura sp. 3N508 TaxID=3375153 RepID=UPI00379B3EB3